MKKLPQGQRRYFIHRFDFASLTKQELSWIIAGALGFKRVAMTGEPGFFQWPGNAGITQLAHKEPVVLVDLQGNLHLECHVKADVPKGTYPFSFEDPVIFQLLIERFKMGLSWSVHDQQWKARVVGSEFVTYAPESKEMAVAKAVLERCVKKKDGPQRAYGFPAVMYEHRLR